MAIVGGTIQKTNCTAQRVCSGFLSLSYWQPVFQAVCWILNGTWTLSPTMQIFFVSTEEHGLKVDNFKFELMRVNWTVPHEGKILSGPPELRSSMGPDRQLCLLSLIWRSRPPMFWFQVLFGQRKDRNRDHRNGHCRGCKIMKHNCTRWKLHRFYFYEKSANFSQDAISTNFHLQ